jgi:putative intracellular protease/amidase
VHLYLFDSLADWEHGYAVAGINNPAMQREPGRYRVCTVGVSREPVTTIGGIRILPDVTLAELDARDSAMLILPGGESWDEGGNMEAAAKAREFVEAGVPVAAICGATAGVARAGLLDDRLHTSNAADYLGATGYGGGSLYRDEAAVADRDVITASSMAPLDFAYQIFKRLGIYDEPTLEAWYGLFRTRDPEYMLALMSAATGGEGGSAAAAG